MALKPSRRPTHPGAFLREHLEDSGTTVCALAEVVGCDREHLDLVVNERQPIKPELAAQLAAGFGGSADLWLGMQAAFDSHSSKAI